MFTLIWLSQLSTCVRLYEWKHELQGQHNSSRFWIYCVFCGRWYLKDSQGIAQSMLQASQSHQGMYNTCRMVWLTFSLVEEQYQLISYQLHVSWQAVHLGQPKNCLGCAEVSQSHQEMYNTHRMDWAVAEQQQGFCKDLFGVEVPVEDWNEQAQCIQVSAAPQTQPALVMMSAVTCHQADSQWVMVCLCYGQQL